MQTDRLSVNLNYFAGWSFCIYGNSKAKGQKSRSRSAKVKVSKGQGQQLLRSDKQTERQRTDRQRDKREQAKTGHTAGMG